MSPPNQASDITTASELDSEAVRDLIDRFTRLDAALRQLSDGIASRITDSWFPAQAPASHLQSALLDYWHTDQGDGRTTRAYYGVVQVDAQTLNNIQSINVLKRSFAEACAALQSGPAAPYNRFKQLVGRRSQPVHLALQDHQLSRLHIKQLTRTLPVLSQVPERLAFHWYQSGRSIRRITKQEAWRRLCAFNQDARHIQIQMRDLANHPDDEPLAVVQELAPIMRLNVKFKDRRTQSQNIALPLFIPDNDAMPTIAAPRSDSPGGRTRKRRSDNRLQDAPFLSSLRVYRYRQPQAYDASLEKDSAD